MITAFVLVAAMGGVQPEGLAATASRACAKKIAQLAASRGAVGVTTQVIGETQLLADGRAILQLRVTIDYRRRSGNEQRSAPIACIVNSRGRVEAIGESIP